MKTLHLPPNLSSFYPKVVEGRLKCSQLMLLGRDGPKSREGESFTGVFPQEVRKRLLLVENQGDSNVENGVIGAVSDLCSAETPGPEGSQEERQSWEKHKSSPSPAQQSFAFGEGKRKGSDTPKS